ncbi:type II secretion system protein [Actinoplanes sp. NPDC049596]|uniref:type IV pilus modification PilV family protein n=1 Tax=unclassified Actinoplanes TaxID=2626549 RepID=UPI0034343AB9
MGSDDDGFSLVEVLVALAILSVTLLASTPFFINSLQNVNRQKTRQGAIQIANTAMEQVRGLKGSSLLTGHGQKAGEDQFAAAPAVVKPYLATMQVGHDADSAVLTTDGADAPLSTAAQVTTVEGTTYTRMVYVGACEVYLTVSSGDCVYPGSTGRPADTTKILQFFRAVVLVSWPDNYCPGGAGNPVNTCQYVASTLVSRAPEPNFDLHRPSPTVMTTLLTFYKGLVASGQLEARGGQLPNTWTVGALPAGLSLTPAGVISGTPTTAGTIVTTTTVTDKLSRTDTEPITFTVVLPTTVTAPANAVNHITEAVSLKATAANGVGPYVYTAANLAPGLVIDATTGAITGTATTAGTYVATITATDQNGVAGSSTYTHVVYPTLTLTAVANQTINLNDKLTLTAAGAGGDGGKYTYSATGLPAGVSINSKTGAISDKVGVSGRFLPTITVTDATGGTGGTASQQFVLIVNTATSLVFTAPPLTAPDQTTVRGTAATLTLATNGGLLGLNPVLTISGLPAGLSFNALTGVISGTPTTAGASTVTATATTVTATSVLTFVWTVT